jgi:hypothetical protein
MGINDVDMDKNIAIGDRYEDVVYVKDGASKAHHSKAAKVSRFAKKSDDSESDSESGSASGSSSSEEEERNLDDLLDVEFKQDVGSAEEAFDAVLRHQD